MHQNTGIRPDHLFLVELDPDGFDPVHRHRAADPAMPGQILGLNERRQHPR